MSTIESTQTGFDNVGQQTGSDQNFVRQMVDMANPSEFQSLIRPLDSQSQPGVTSNGQMVFDNPYSSGGSNGGQGQSGGGGGEGGWGNGNGWGQGGGWDHGHHGGNGGDNGNGQSGGGTANTGGENGILQTEATIANTEGTIANVLAQDIAAMTGGTTSTDVPPTSTGATTADAPTTSTTPAVAVTTSGSGDSTVAGNPAGSSTSNPSSSQVLSSLEQSDPSLNQVITDATNGNANTAALSAQGLSDVENAIVANNPSGNPNLDAAAAGQAIAAVQNDTSNPNAATDASNLQAILQTDMPAAVMMANLDQNDPTLAQTLTTAAGEISSQGNTDLQQYVLNNYGTTSDSQLLTNAVAAVQGDTSNPNAASDASALQTLAADSNVSTTASGGDNSSASTTPTDSSSSSASTSGEQQVLQQIETTLTAIEQDLTTLINEVGQLPGVSDSSGDSTAAGSQSGSSTSNPASSQVLASLEQQDPSLNQVITDATNGNANTPGLSAQGLSDLENAIVANNPTGNPNLDAAALGAAVAAVQGDTNNPNAATDASNLQAILQSDDPTAAMMANLDQNDPTLAQTLTTAVGQISSQGNTDLQQYVLNNYGTTSDSQLFSNAIAAVQGDTNNPDAASDASALQTLAAGSNLSTTSPGGDNSSSSTTSPGGDNSSSSTSSGDSSTTTPSSSQVLASLEQQDPSLNQVITDATNGNSNTAALSAQGLSDLENAIVANNPTGNPNLDAAALGSAVAALQGDTNNPNAATDASNLQAILQSDYPTAAMMANLDQNDPTLAQTLTTAAGELSQQGNTDLQNYVLNNYGTTSDSQLMSNAVTAVQGDTSNPTAASDVSALQTLLSQSTLSTTAPGADSSSTGTQSTDGSTASSSGSSGSSIEQQFQTQLAQIEQQIASLLAELNPSAS